MADLSTNYLGLKLRNPIIAGSSNLSMDIKNIKAMEEAGVGAIVYKSLFEEQVNFESADLDEDLQLYNDRHAEMIKIHPEMEHAGPKDFLLQLKKIKEIFAIVAVSPRAAGLEMKKPYIFEAMVSGGDIAKQFAHVKEHLGKEIKIDQIFETGSTVDVAAITKGHGWQGVMRRWGVKKKQHKSRKTVREVGSLGPISPQSVMYTVPRSGQTGFHQRVDYDKRIMIMGHTESDESKINEDGGSKHIGLLKETLISLKVYDPVTKRI